MKKEFVLAVIAAIFLTIGIVANDNYFMGVALGFAMSSLIINPIFKKT